MCRRAIFGNPAQTCRRKIKERKQICSCANFLSGARARCLVFSFCDASARAYPNFFFLPLLRLSIGLHPLALAR